MKKQELLILRGLPASGKTSFARTWVNEDSKTRIRINRDDIRKSLGPYWVPSRENLVSTIETLSIHNALKQGYNVIIDATNLKEIDWKVKLGLDNNIIITEIDLTDVPLEECIRRDALREGDSRVGEKVIKNMYNKYLKDV